MIEREREREWEIDNLCIFNFSEKLGENCRFHRETWRRPCSRRLVPWPNWPVCPMKSHIRSNWPHRRRSKTTAYLTMMALIWRQQPPWETNDQSEVDQWWHNTREVWLDSLWVVVCSWTFPAWAVAAANRTLASPTRASLLPSTMHNIWLSMRDTSPTRFCCCLLNTSLNTSLLFIF